MATKTLTFDPDGDLLLILSSAPTDDTEISNSVSVESEISEQSGDEAQGDIAIQPELNSVNEVNGVDSMSANSEDLVLNAFLKKDTFSKSKRPEIFIHMLVSSKHMILASPVFKAMLQTNIFKEGQKLGANGKVEVPLPEDDPAAFEVVLNAIHGRNKLVPRILSLKLLASISLVVDKYQIAEAVEPFSDSWINALNGDLPQVYMLWTESANNTLLWLQVSWVFEKAELFTKMTRLLERGCNEHFPRRINERIVIPDLVISMSEVCVLFLISDAFSESILAKHREAPSELYDLIEETIKRYQQPQILCRRTDDTVLQRCCDSLILGSLLKSARKLDIIPVPEPHQRHLSFDEMSERLYSLDVHSLCETTSGMRFGGFYPKTAHGLKDSIKERILPLEERLSGLDIQAFKGKGKSSRPLVGV
jgi:hypothetical protein